MNNETLIAKLVIFEFNGTAFTNDAHQEEFLELGLSGDKNIKVQNLIAECTEEQVKALWKYEQRKAFFSLEDRLCELMGDDAAFEWIEDQ